MSAVVVEVRGDHPYPVLVGAGVMQELASRVPEGVARVAVVHPGALAPTAARLRDQLAGQGIQTLLLEIPDAESAKTAEVAQRCWAELGGAGFTRTDLVVGLGGGATTDLAGFVAATWLRGVRVIHLPTTLLGMVDAAIGGKTAINTAAGKNLVGAFHSPTLVLCDLDALTTVPRPDYGAGLAEIIKAGFIRDPEILELVGDDPAGAVTPGGRHTRDLIVRAVRVKADVVAADPTEAGEREILNYGHTLGHAIERREGYRWRHGDAVSIGLVYAAALARCDGRISDEVVALHRSLLTGVGLPVTYPAQAWPELRETMRVDKKSRGRRLRFVVLDGIGAPARLDDPPDDLLAAAYEEVAR
jgi:3-dehydroquinate synthase